MHFQRKSYPQIVSHGEVALVVILPARDTDLLPALIRDLGLAVAVAGQHLVFLQAGDELLHLSLSLVRRLADLRQAGARAVGDDLQDQVFVDLLKRGCARGAARWL